MKQLFLKVITFSLVLIFPSLIVADTAAKVDSWFNNMNYSSVTTPGVYEGQTARYATLGGLSMRAPVTQPFQLFNVQTPKFTAGCGGLDFYTGGFSAIDANQFVDNLRAIGQNAQSLAFMLAIQIVSPQLSDQMESIQAAAAKFQNMAQDSCQAATALVGGGLKVLDREKSSCIATRQTEHLEDFVTASFACSTGGQRKSTIGADGERNKTDFVKGNIAWYVLMQDPFFRGDTSFAEVVMNITGTAIIDDVASPDSDAPSALNSIPAAITSTTEKERFDNIYKALLHGQNAHDKLQIYRCDPITDDPNGCLVVSSTLQVINPGWVGLYERVEMLLNSIVNKISTDAPLDLQEQGLVRSTTVPIFRFLSAATTQFPVNTNISAITKEYTSLIAHDILLRSLKSIVEQAEYRSKALKKGLGEGENVKVFREQLEEVMAGLEKKRKENEYTANQMLSMQTRIYQYEKALLPMLSNNIVNGSMWGR